MKYSVIIPQRNSLSTLPRLFNSIPISNDIEIILVDNSPVPLKKEDLGIERDYILLWSDPCRHAGGARNEGLKYAKGKWLIFADADDYFYKDAFEKFEKYYNNEEEVVYFCASGVYNDTGQYSTRGERYSNLVKGYLNGTKKELDLRLLFHTPWAKMIKRSLVERYSISFDEVRASNDVFFSTKIGLYAKSVCAVNDLVYIVTVSTGSLTRSRSFDICYSRFLVTLRRNKFLRENNLSDYQDSILIYFYQARTSSIAQILSMIKSVINYRQNPFVGCKLWLSHFIQYKNNNKLESRYITK